MTTKDALVAVFSRNLFYKRLHYLALAALGLSFVVVGLLAGALYFLLKNPPRPLYFATDEVGRLIPIFPVTVPHMTLEEVKDWVTEAVQNTYSYDHINYRAQLQHAQRYFTTYGWTNYMRALTASNNLVALTERKQIVIAKVVPPMKLMSEGLLGGAYAWKFEMPVLITYWEPPYDEKSRNVNALEVTVIVQRQEILKSDRGLGILQIIARMVASPALQQPRLESPNV